MFEYTAEDLFAIITSQQYQVDQKLKVILDLKQHIKKFFVDLREVNKYFETLKYALKSSDPQYSFVCFGTVCHLVKRVGMQDPNALRSCSKTVLPILVQKLLDDKPNIRSQAKKTLETYWLATPTVVEAYIRDGALIHSNPKIRSEAIVFISDLIDLNQSFLFSSFLPNLVNLLRDDFVEVVKNVEVLLIKYYTLQKPKLPDLIKEMKSQKIERKVAVPIIRELDPMLSNSYTIEPKPPAAASKTTIDTFNNLSRLKRSTSSFGTRPSKLPTSVSTGTRTSNGPGIIDSTVAITDVQSLMDGIPTTKLETNIKPIVSHSEIDLKRDVEALLLPFEGKETEFNWGNREKNIIKFRGLVKGNSEMFPEDLVQCTRLLQDGIFKTISSLRTTLSSNGCQLVKELAINLNKLLDPLVEMLFQPLAALTSSTKKIASSNAFGSLCVLINSTSFNSRILNQCFQLYQDKNVQPRLYSSTFLQIFIMKHSSRIDNSNMEIIVKWITKGISDPNTTVRESMRSTFWLYYRAFEDTAETIYQKQDANIKKALDRAKPSDIKTSTGESATASSSLHKRSSVKEFVAAKYKEKRMNSTGLNQTRHSDRKSTNDPFSSLLEHGKSSRLAVVQRQIGNRASSAGSIISSATEPPLLPQKLSRGSVRQPFDSSQKGPSISASRVSSLPDERILELNDTNKETDVEKLSRLIQSSLAKERLEGLEILKNFMSQDQEIPDLSTPIQNLIILDHSMIKPFLCEPRFFELINLDLALKVIATNRLGYELLNSKYSATQIVEALLDLITILDNIRFDTAPSTIFHIKHKNLLLNFCIGCLFKISQTSSFQPSDSLFTHICEVIFPLSITDYPYYDELILQFHAINNQLFDENMQNSSKFIQGSISAILSSFKDDFNRTSQSGITEEQRLNEMTMINPMAKLSSDPTLSLNAGFRTDMTMVVPAYLQPKKNDKDVSSPANVEEDRGAEIKNKKEIDYFQDIFQSEDKISQVCNVADDEMDLDTEEDAEYATHPATVSLVDRDDSPFIDNTPDVTLDDATSAITNQISDIYISPEKRSVDTKPTMCELFDQLIDRQDQSSSNIRKRITLFDNDNDNDDDGDVDLLTQRMVDLHFNKIQMLNSSDVVSQEDLKTLLLRFDEDKVNLTSLNNMMVMVYYCSKSNHLSSWMRSEGYQLVLETMLRYFLTSSKLTKDICFKGLVVFNELLELNHEFSSVQVMKLFDVLLMIIENLKDTKNEIYVIVEEIVDNLLLSNKNEILDSTVDRCVHLLKENTGSIINIFLLLTLNKAISKYDLLETEQIERITQVLRLFLSDQEVEIRKLTVLAYSKIMKNLKVVDQGHVNIGSKDEILKQRARETLDGVFSTLCQPSKSLITHYCENII